MAKDEINYYFLQKLLKIHLKLQINLNNFIKVHYQQDIIKSKC